MKRFIFNAFVIALLLTSHTLAAQTIDKKFFYDIDVRQALQEQSALGIDFDLRYSIEKASAAPQGHQFNFTLAAKGFRALEEVDEDVDHIALEINLGGQYYSTAQATLPAQLQMRYLDLAERDGAGDTLTPKENKEYNDLFRRYSNDKRFFTYAATYRYETTQDFEADQHALGIGLSAELPLVHHFLDAIPAQTRDPASPFKPQPVRIHGGLDYVAGIDDTAVGEAGEANDMGRIRLQAAWATQVLDELVLRATWEAQYLLYTPPTLEKKDRFNSFLQIWMIYPIAAKTGVLVKYVNGRLPPNYEQTSGGGVGFSITFQ